MPQRIDFVEVASLGRVFASEARVRLADVTPSGRLRLDSIARILQDVSSDDTESANSDDAGAVGGDAGVDARVEVSDPGIWILRRLALRVARLPTIGTRIALRTWCSGLGPRWAERRTDLMVGDEERVAAAALWVCTDRRTGAPRSLPEGFHAVFGPSAARRTVTSRLGLPAADADAALRPWVPRAVDFDVVGHLNNASYWAPIEEALAEARPARRIARATIEFRGGIDPGEPVELFETQTPSALAQWWSVHGDARASALVEFAE